MKPIPSPRAAAEASLNVTNYASTRRSKRAAISICVVLLLIVALILPIAKLAGPVIPAFLPGFISAVIFCELITAYLMYSEFRVTRELPIALLAAAYLFTGLIAIPHILTFPGVFSPEGLLHASPQTAVWLWVFWHGGYPVLVMLYILAERLTGGIKLTPKQAKITGAAAIVSALALLIVLTLVAIFGTEHLPVIIQKDNFTVLITSGVGPLVLLLNAACLGALIYFTRGKTVIQLWLTVALFASVLDVTLTLFSGSRYSMGWYAARLNSILSASLVLGTLLFEIRTLYYRIVQQERIFRTVFEFAAVGITRINPDRRPLEANTALLHMVGYTEQELQSRYVTEFTHPEDVYKDAHLWEELVQGKRKSYAVEKRYLHRDGHVVWGNSIVSVVPGVDEKPEFFIGMVEDISKRKTYEEQIRFQAYHDGLTGLPNRVLFADRLNLAVIQARRNQEQLAVCFLDLDGFKQVNDTLGHDIGDLLLREVAARLTSAVRASDTVARMGGDEFTMILPNLTDQGDATRIAAKIVALFEAPFELNGHRVRVTTSVGIALHPRDGEDVQTLMKHADIAMYQAKENGKNRFVLFRPQP